MQYKPDLSNAKVIGKRQDESSLSEREKQIRAYFLDEIMKDTERRSYNTMEEVNGYAVYVYPVGTSFRLGNLSYDGEFKYKGFKMDDSTRLIPIYRLMDGCNQLNSFYSSDAEKSYDYDEIPPSRILDIPGEYEAALNKMYRYIGKKLRVIARSPAGTGRYLGRNYLYVIED